VSAARLQSRPLEKVWGKRKLPAPFEAFSKPGKPIGEIWFEGKSRLAEPLLAKYLFTSEKLSIQVHPDNDAARALGHRSGKDEAWLVLNADPGAAIAIGLRKTVTAEELQAAALEGTLEQLVHWQPVKAGDIFYSPAGTVHAIGAGVCLIEIQQNVDVTFRLYDYGRDRELHLRDGVAAANLGPYALPSQRGECSPGREVVAAGGAFVLERWCGVHDGVLTAPAGCPITVVPVKGSGTIDGSLLKPGEVWTATGLTRITLDAEAEILIAYPGSDVIDAPFA
jgi:mannose-6-phosphate isomerase